MLNEGETTDTWDVLKKLGFLPDDEVVSDVRPGLSFDFGNFRLSASCCINMRFAEIVLFTGVMTTPRTIAEVQFEMPRQVQSAELCAAWIVWQLDKMAKSGSFVPAKAVEWLAEGRTHQNLLPWISDMTLYKARPRCAIESVWLRVALKTLREVLTTADKDEEVIFGFDGAVLTVQCIGKVIPMPGEGIPWPKHYTIQAGKIRNLPKRLMSERVEVSIWQTRLNIGRNSYEGISVAEAKDAM